MYNVLNIVTSIGPQRFSLFFERSEKLTAMAPHHAPRNQATQMGHAHQISRGCAQKRGFKGTTGVLGISHCIGTINDICIIVSFSKKDICNRLSAIHIDICMKKNASNVDYHASIRFRWKTTSPLCSTILKQHVPRRGIDMVQQLQKGWKQP